MVSEITSENLMKDLEELKRIATIPDLYLANHFIRLRNDVDKEIVPSQLILKNNEEKKIELNDIWQKMIEKIDSFEKNCIRKKHNLEANKKRLNEIETMLKSKEAISLKETEEDIKNEEIILIKKLFQNKTILFTKTNDKKIITNCKLILLNDEFISEKSVNER